MKAATLQLADFGTNHGVTDDNITPRLVGDIDGNGFIDFVAFKTDGVYVSFTDIVCSHSTRDPLKKCDCKVGFTDLGDG